MENLSIEKRFADALVEAERSWQSAEHVVKVIMPVVKDQKLLLRALETLHKGAVMSISTILKYEYLHKHIQLYKDVQKNMETFFNKCAHKYDLSIDERKTLKKMLILGKKHKESGFEFQKIGKMVILDDNLETTEITRQTIDDFISVLRKLLFNARNIFTKSKKYNY